MLSRSLCSENLRCCRHNQDARSVVRYVPSHEVRRQLYLFTEHIFITPFCFCLCMRLIYSFIFTAFLLFLLSIVSSFLLPLYKSPSVRSSLLESFSLFCLLFLNSVSCVQFLPLFLFCSPLISFLLCLSLYLVFRLFLLTSVLSFILFYPCNLFVPVSVLLRLFFLLIYATFFCAPLNCLVFSSTFLLIFLPVLFPVLVSFLSVCVPFLYLPFFSFT